MQAPAGVLCTLLLIPAVSTTVMTCAYDPVGV